MSRPYYYFKQSITEDKGNISEKMFSALWVIKGMIK